MEETPPSPKTPADSPAVSRTARRLRARTRSLSSSISSLSSSSPFTSPSPSPSPLSWAIPFSWEQRPGIPKSLPSPAAFARPLLPLPPPLRSHSHLSTPRKKRPAARPSAAAVDPFAAALELCAKGLPDDVEGLWVAPGAPRRAAATIADRFRLFDLYGSCKTTCTVVEATVRLPRTRSICPLDRQPGSNDI